jgi:type IV pilus assembly protein PilV
MSTTSCNRGCRRWAGCTLLEALIALSILAVGVLGSMTLLLASLRSSRESMQHSAAVRLAGDLAERVRANRAALTTYAFDSTVAPTAVGASCGVGVRCSPADRARADLEEWQQALAATLPRATARLTLSDLTVVDGALCIIELSWGESGPAGGAYTLRLRARHD